MNNPTYAISIIASIVLSVMTLYIAYGMLTDEEEQGFRWLGVALIALIILASYHLVVDIVNIGRLP